MGDCEKGSSSTQEVRLEFHGEPLASDFRALGWPSELSTSLDLAG